MNVQTKPRPGRLVAILALSLPAVCLLFLAPSLLQQTALSQGLIASLAESTPTPTPAPACYGVSPPLTGQTARVVADEEIFVMYRYDSDPRYLRDRVINVANGALTSVWAKDLTSITRLSELWWLSAAAGDLNGTSDGKRKDQMIMGFQNDDQSIAAIADPFNTAIAYDDWYNDSDRTDGGELDDVDVATGNLDRSSDNSDEIVLAFSDDPQDYHVVVLDGNSNGIIANSDKSQSIDFWEDQSPGHERGQTYHYGVATGDLNGDGYNNEIVTAFKDSGADLQVVVLRPDLSTSPTSAQIIYYWDSYPTHPTPIDDTVAAEDNQGFYENWRPIDATTGDVDGDQKDEVIVAARDGPGDQGHISLMVFDFEPEDTTTHELKLHGTAPVWVDHSDLDGVSYANYEAALAISLSAADLDGDGYDEIALGYTVVGEDMSGTYWHLEQQRLLTYEYLQAFAPDWQTKCAPAEACLIKKAEYGSLAKYGMKSDANETVKNEIGPYSRVSIATGDVDADGMAEIALGHINPDGDVEVYAFNAEGASLATIGTAVKVDLGTSPVYDVAVAMGDYDGDSKWGTYAGTCAVKEDATLQAVLLSPPFWPKGRGLYGCDNSYRTKASFNKTADLQKGVSHNLGSTVSGSATFGKRTDLKALGIGGSAGSGWERSSFASQGGSVTAEVGVASETTAPVNGDDWDYELVQYIKTTQWCYDYTVPGVADLVPVCVPRPDETGSSTKKGMAWYQDGPTDYPDSWVPVGMNLAEDKEQKQRIADESTKWSGSTPNGDAWRAVDGNTDGNYANGSVSRTQNVETDPYPWWQLNLGGLQWIDAIRIWNRTDAESEKLTGYWVFVTDQDAFSSSDPNVLQNDSTVWSYHYTDAAAETFTIPLVTTPAERGKHYGRLVRIQLDHQDNLALAEVQVYGMPGTPDQWPKAISPDSLTAPADSFTLTWRNGRTQKIARPLYLVVPYGSKMTNESGEGDNTILTGVGGERYTIQGSGGSESKNVGLEIMKKFTLSAMDSQQQMRSTSWDQGLEFTGVAMGLYTESDARLKYEWKPYVWMQQAVPAGGGSQEFLVWDWIVPSATDIGVNPPNPPVTPDDCPYNESPIPAYGPLAAPQAPLIDSPTHPDPDTWYPGDTVTFNWAQPAGDPATVETYDWSLDRSPDTVPIGYNLGPTPTKTYEGLNHGVWYFHVRAMSDEREWGATGHRMVRVDAVPPEVSLSVDPAHPDGNGDWTITPPTVTVEATDGIGSGVAGVEYSTDGAAWTPYTAPLVLSADTLGATIYARASDAVGNVSEPVSTTVKIDLTPPDSHVDGGAGPGAWIAGVVTNPAGNQELVLAGSIADNLSGRAGMVLEQDGMYWGANAEIGSWHFLPDPGIEVNWVYTATNDLGAGYHIFTGRAFDEAGNAEAAYEIGRVKWFPSASPELGGSSLEASQTAARPGDVILFTLVARNGGFQEAHVAVSAALPEGLEPVLEALPADVDYDAGTRTLTWPAPLLWPGWSEPRSFAARVDDGLDATTLETEATFHAFWPNTDLLPGAERQLFEDREQTVVAKASLVVNPALPAGADLTAPWAILVQPNEQIADGAEVSLGIVAAPDARRMYLREWTLDPDSGDWTVARSSGWIDYSRTTDWTLSSGQGIKYIGVWVADGAGNVSPPMEPNLAFVNRMDASQELAPGQRVQYRGLVAENQRASLLLATLSGDPDMYAWGPRNAFRPTAYSNDTALPGQTEYLTTPFDEGGRYLLEVQAVGASEYELSVVGQGGASAAASGAALVKAPPPHPLTVSDPLSAGQLGPEVGLYGRWYLPLVFKNQ